MFKWEKLKYWKIGTVVYEVTPMKKIKKPTSAEKNSDGVVDHIESRIYLRETILKKKNPFLATLFHEIDHAVNFDYEAELNSLSDSLETEEQFEQFSELTTQIRSSKWLQLVLDNKNNFLYIYSQEEKCSGTRKNRKS